MKECQECGQLTANPKYCSSSCAAKYNNKNRGSRSEETKKKISESIIAYNISIGKINHPTLVKKNKSTVAKITKALKISLEEKILLVDFNSLKFERIRKRVIIEQNNKCSVCKIDSWRGKEITLELDHIDGDNKNNSRNNLVALCPNCHSQTPTWRGRNKKNQGGVAKKVSDKDLIEALLVSNWNIRQALITVGLAPKGGNYPRCHKIKRHYFDR